MSDNLSVQMNKLLGGFRGMLSFPGGASGKEPACQPRRHKRRRFDPWVRKIPWRDHSSILAWRIPWTEEPGRLWSMGHKELDTTEMTNTFTFKIVPKDQK